MENQILKLYGLSKEEIENSIEDIKQKYQGKVKISIKEKYNDSAIDISAVLDNTITDAVREIMQKLGKHVYAENNQTLYEKLAEILMIRNKKICLMEQATGGIIAMNLMAIEGASKHIVESLVIPSVDAWLTKFDLDPRVIRENSGISSKLIFMIASSMRRTSLADYYIVAVSSDADGLDVYNLENSNTQNHISLVAIGDNNGVEIYKQKTTGSVRDRINQTAKSLCYKLITELKNN